MTMKKKFKLSKHEEKSAERFIRTHNCSLEEPKTSFTFSPGSIGTSVNVSCGCGKSKNITDYGKW